MITFRLTYWDGSSRLVDVMAQSQLMDVAKFYDAESAEILSFKP